MAVGNMLRMLRGNQETLISPANKEEYLKKGYSVIDEDGTVLLHGIYYCYYKYKKYSDIMLCVLN